MISDLASLILNSPDLSWKLFLGATGLRKSKIDILKIKVDRKYFRTMLYLTVVIAVTTMVNIIIFLERVI